MSTTGMSIAVAVLVAAAAAGLWWRRRDGTLRQPAGPPAGAGADPARQAVLALLGGPPRHQVTVVQFSSAHCGPCVVTRRICAELVADQPSVGHLEFDVDDQLDAVRSLDIRRTPTVLVLDSTGRVVRRGAGRTDRATLVAAVAAAREPGPHGPGARTWPAAGHPTSSDVDRPAGADRSVQEEQ